MSRSKHQKHSRKCYPTGWRCEWCERLNGIQNVRAKEMADEEIRETFSNTLTPEQLKEVEAYLNRPNQYVEQVAQILAIPPHLVTGTDGANYAAELQFSQQICGNRKGEL